MSFLHVSCSYHPKIEASLNHLRQFSKVDLSLLLSLNSFLTRSLFSSFCIIIQKITYIQFLPVVSYNQSGMFARKYVQKSIYFALEIYNWRRREIFERGILINYFYYEQHYCNRLYVPIQIRFLRSLYLPTMSPFYCSARLRVYIWYCLKLKIYCPFATIAQTKLF